MSPRGRGGGRRRPHLAQATARCPARRIRPPHAQLRPGGIGLVDPAVGIVVEAGEFGKAVAAGGSESSRPSSMRPLALRSKARKPLPLTSGIFSWCRRYPDRSRSAPPEAAAGAAEVEHQWILQALVAGAHTDRHRLGVAARHLEAELETDLGTVRGAHHAGGARRQSSRSRWKRLLKSYSSRSRRAVRQPGRSYPVCAGLIARLGGVGRLQVAHAEAPHRLAGEELDHADQHGEARIVFDCLLGDRVHRRSRALGRQGVLARRRAPPPGLRARRCGAGIARALARLRALTGLQRLGETVRDWSSTLDAVTFMAKASQR